MTTHARGGLKSELLEIELHEVDRSNHNGSPVLEDTDRTPSHVSTFTGPAFFDDDEQLLIPRHGYSIPEGNLGGSPDGRGMPSRLSRKKRSNFKSWKVGVMAAAAMTTVVLLVNSILTIWASVSFGLEAGIGTAYNGSCDVVSAWSFWLHILINALSSALLSASNYTMQCVTAPTRRECDVAHARGDWLDIGVPSVRNLSRISWLRRVMWALLALSSTPIHLLYNSAVFKTLDNNYYDTILVNRDFLEPDYTMPSREVLANASSGARRDGGHIYHTLSTIHEVYANNQSSFERLTPEMCINAYATYYLSGHGNVILVASAELVPTELDPYGDIDFKNGDGYYLSYPLNEFNW